MTPDFSRRDILKTGASIVSMAWGFKLVLPPRVALAEDATIPARAVSLANVLRSIGGDVCIDAAMALEALPDTADSFNLHLRQAGLNRSGAGVLADALKVFQSTESTAIASLSVSYNPEIGDAGAVAIVNALPKSLPELGMVGCNIGDQTGEALLRWAQTAPHLHTICIERNRFSAGMEARFDGLARQRPDILLVI